MSDITTENAELRDKLIAYVFWFFLGFFGAHRFWWAKYKTATVMLVMLILGWILVIAGGIFSIVMLSENELLSKAFLGTGFLFVLGFVMLGVHAIWWFIDAVLILCWPPKK